MEPGSKTGKKTSLRKKIIWIVILAASIPILIFFLINSRMIYNYYSDLLYKDQKERVELGGQRISSFIMGARNVLLTKAESGSFQNYKIQTMRADLDKAINRFEYILKLTVYDDKGNPQFILSKDRETDETLVESSFDNRVDTDDTLNDDGSGGTVATSQEETKTEEDSSKISEGKKTLLTSSVVSRAVVAEMPVTAGSKKNDTPEINKTEPTPVESESVKLETPVNTTGGKLSHKRLSGKMIETIKEDGDYISDIYYDKSKLPRISIYVPIKNSSDEMIGVLSGEIDLNHIYRIIKKLSTKKRVFAYLVSDSGKILIHPGKAKLRSDFEWSSIPPVKAIMERNWDPPETRLPVYTNADGVKVVGTISNIAGTHWSLVLEHKESDVFDKIREFFLISLAVSMLILLICILFAFRYIRFLLSPFDKLYEGVEAIAHGNLNYRIDINTGDEIQQFADAFNRMSLSLEEQVNDRTRTLEELQKKKKELEVSNLQLKEASRLRSEFLANMSHELRTPMNTIIGYTSIILDGIYGELSPKQENSLRKIFQNARSLSHLIDDVLDLSKIDSGKMPVFKERFIISAVVQELLTNYQDRLDEKKLEIKLDFKDDVEIETDRSKVKQVLDHLLSNAIKFTQEGSITFSSEITSARDYLKVNIADTGIGIEPESLERIFDEFRQLDGSFTREFGGTGLGLSIVKKILNIIDSKITVKSKVGEGSVFSIYIPMIQEKESPVGFIASERPREHDTSELEDVTKKLILVIDDDPDVVEMMRDIVRKTDYRVVGATSGKEGIELAKKMRPYLITTDIFMPDISGWEIIKELKSNPITLDIPIFVISISDEKAKGYSMGISEYFVKPIERDLFLKRLAVLSRLRAKKILIVDDDYSFLENFFRIVREHGFQIVSCDNGKEGLEKIKVEKPDVLILDIMMPKFSGFDFINAMEKEGINSDLPVIVMSAKELTRKEHEELSKKVFSIVRKSGVTREELLPRLRSIFERIWCLDVMSQGKSSGEN